MLEIHATSRSSFLEIIIKSFCLLEDRNLPFERTKDLYDFRITIFKGILAPNFEFLKCQFFTILNGKSLRFNQVRFLIRSRIEYYLDFLFQLILKCLLSDH